MPQAKLYQIIKRIFEIQIYSELLFRTPRVDWLRVKQNANCFEKSNLNSHWNSQNVEYAKQSK
jgi:hypothetical protein